MSYWSFLICYYEYFTENNTTEYKISENDANCEKKISLNTIMIYHIDSDYYWWFLKEAQKAESKWEKKFGDKSDIGISRPKMSYIDFFNSQTS